MAVKLKGKDLKAALGADFLPPPEATKKEGRGGARPGAGRKPSIPAGATVWAVRVTSEEKAALMALLADLRSSAQMI